MEFAILKSAMFWTVPPSASMTCVMPCMSNHPWLMAGVTWGVVDGT